jgi:hypothetical protein
VSANAPALTSDGRRGTLTSDAALTLTARAAGGLALLGTVGVSLWIALAAAERPSQLSDTSVLSRAAPWLVGPLAHRLPGLTTDHARLRDDLLVALTALLACWLVAVASAPRLPMSWVVAAAWLTGLIFFLSPPFAMTDLFNYLHYGQMGAAHGANPYAVLPASVPSVPGYGLSNWHHMLSPYGPLFTLLTYALAPLPLHTAYWTWKAIVLASSFGVLAIVWWAAARVGRSPQAAVALVAFNPLVLVYGLGGEHNDALMLLCVVGAVALVIGAAGSRRPAELSAAAGASAVAGAALKLSAGVLAPLVVVSARPRRAALLGAVAAAVAGALVVVTVFGGHLPATAAQERLATPLSLPQVFGWLLGQGGSTAVVRSVSHVVLAVAVAGAIVAVWGHPSRLAGACGFVMLATVLSLSWTMPWYVWWILPFAALARTRWLTAACVLLTVWLAFGASPQMPQIIHGAGYYPTRTAAGKANHAYMEYLLN